jgi:probable rRNA maturation factor
MAISVMIDHKAWKGPLAVNRLARRAARAALKVAGADPSRYDLSVNFTDDATLVRLNRKWRAKNRPTNVLSFPARRRPGERFLGDVILAAGVIKREAEEQGKSLSSHASHLIVHGVLHLLGHDHHEISAARKMQRMEVRAMESLGIKNPYHQN